MVMPRVCTFVYVCACVCAPGVVASDEEPIAPGLSLDDTLTLFFAKPTSQPDVSTPARVRALISISPASLATTVRGVWVVGGAAPYANAAEQVRCSAPADLLRGRAVTARRGNPRGSPFFARPPPPPICSPAHRLPLPPPHPPPRPFPANRHPPPATRLRLQPPPPPSPRQLVLTLGGTVSGDVLGTVLPLVLVSILPGGGLRDAGLLSHDAAIANLTVGGSWGDASQPRFLATYGAVALDYGQQPGLGAGDGLVR